MIQQHDPKMSCIKISVPIQTFIPICFGSKLEWKKESEMIGRFFQYIDNIKMIIPEKQRCPPFIIFFSIKIQPQTHIFLVLFCTSLFCN